MVDESEPGRRAPEPLHLVQRFVNSVDLEDGDEELESPEALRTWLATRGLMDPDEPVGQAELSRALDVREGLRALLLANNGEAYDEARVERLDRAAQHAGLRARFAPGEQPALAPEGRGVDGALAHLLGVVAAAAAQGDWQRLKACPRDDCMWAFYDHSRNRSGRWCRMESCGSVEKARAYRRRRAAERS